LPSEGKKTCQAVRNTNTSLEGESRFSLNFQVVLFNPGYTDAILSFDTNMVAVRIFAMEAGSVLFKAGPGDMKLFLEPSAQNEECAELYCHLPICFHCVALN
jgi:hypothetical protein